ncbi:hypothetical protein [Microbacterium aureliae]
MTVRLASTFLALGLAAAALTGCDADPAPTETPPPFATEEEAFAAAEATYRAYVDAVNSVDLADPESFEPVFRLSTDELNANDRHGLSKYHADGVRVEGESVVVLIQPLEYEDGDVTLGACLDVSQISVTSAQGESLVDPDRVDVQSYEVRLKPAADSETRMKISGIGPREGEPTCG